VIPRLGVVPLLGVANPRTGGTEATVVKTSSVDSEFARARNICIGSIFPFPLFVVVGRSNRDGSDSSFVGIRSFCFRSLLSDVKIPSRNFWDWYVNCSAAWVD
jgi:hypothetical protein